MQCLQSYHLTNLTCFFEHKEGRVVNATYANNKIICNSIAVSVAESYPTKVTSQGTPVNES